MLGTDIVGLDNDVYLFTTEFSFTDKPMTTTEVLRHGQAVSYPMTTYYEYNERNDQLEKVTISQGGNNEIVSEITYNDLGQIETEARANNSDLVNYSYEFHGWIKKIESPFFEEELYYADAINGLIPRYNGNISAQSWKVDGKKHGYVFSYDGRDMMTNATYIEERSTSIAVSNKFNESATYNVNGGIASLTRKGKNNNNQYVNIDQLSYEYDGNKVKNITDGVTSKLSYKDAFEYRNMHNYIDDERDDFEYNHAGMLIKDRDKGITEITYNNIGLVDSICFSNGNRVKYVYSMTGEKLKVTHYTSRISLSSSRTDSSPHTNEAGTSGTAANNQLSYGSLSSTPELTDSLVASSGQIQTGIQVPLVKSSETTYVGSNITFEMDGKYNYLFGGGYCEFKPCAAYADSIKYYYYTKDHQGNIRNVLTKNDNGTMEELQHTSYYPFGGIIAALSTGRDVQNRLYNGKEQDFANNLFWLDYGARQYDPTRGQFTNYDQHCENYYNMNPLAYCHNNPIMRIDPDGMDDHYTTKGIYVYTDDKETDNIIIGVRPYVSAEIDGQDLPYVLCSGSNEEVKPLEDTNLSASVYCNIFTDILSRVGGLDESNFELRVAITKDGNVLKKTENKSVSNAIAATHYASGVTYTSINIMDDPVMGNDGNVWKTSHRFIFATVSNVINILKDHEYAGHGKTPKGEDISNEAHREVYKKQFGSASYKTTTPDYKYFMENCSEWVNLR